MYILYIHYVFSTLCSYFVEGWKSKTVLNYLKKRQMWYHFSGMQFVLRGLGFSKGTHTERLKHPIPLHLWPYLISKTFCSWMQHLWNNMVRKPVSSLKMPMVITGNQTKAKLFWDTIILAIVLSAKCGGVSNLLVQYNQFEEWITEHDYLMEK